VIAATKNAMRNDETYEVPSTDGSKKPAHHGEPHSNKVRQNQHSEICKKSHTKSQDQDIAKHAKVTEGVRQAMARKDWLWQKSKSKQPDAAGEGLPHHPTPGPNEADGQNEAHGLSRKMEDKYPSRTHEPRMLKPNRRIDPTRSNRRKGIALLGPRIK